MSQEARIEVDEITKERWIKQMMEDFPNIDRLMCELVIGKWSEDPEYFDKLQRGEITIPPPLERNTETVYKGVTIDPVLNGSPEDQEV